MTVIAKPVIDKKFWILTENDVKIGNVEALNGGYQLKVNNDVQQYDTVEHLQQNLSVVFEMPKPYQKTLLNEVHGYPVNSRPYNPVWDITRKVPLFTTKKKSTCWVAAGWYRISRINGCKIVLCPKLILLQRYSYEGPFRTQEEALSTLVSHV